LPRVLPFALALFAAGCANFGAISQGDSVERVAAKVGAAGTVWKNPDGSEVWEYPQGPIGVQTFMIDMGPDRVVHGVYQVLSDEYFSKVLPGMTRDEVRRLLGRPKEIWIFPTREEETWSWRYQELYARYMFFNVLFDGPSGTVRTTQRLDEIFGGRGGRH
jgi:hypothetical protein